MTREGGALGFVIRLLLGGALISGGLLYAAQSMQKGSASKEPVVEKIGPALTTRQAAQPARIPPPSSEPTVPAPAPGQNAAVTPPALEPVPQARVSSSFTADPVPAAPAARSQTPAPSSAAPVTPETFGVVPDDAPAPGEARQAQAGARGQRGAQGCTQYKSYNPTTQTYRSFDGKIKDCRP